MSLPVITDTFRVVLNWHPGSGGANAVNVMHFRSTTLDSGTLYTALNANVVSAMWDWVANGISVDSVDITPLDGSTATTSFVTGGPAKWTGQGAGTGLPQVAGIVKLTTPLRGRSYRGRVYLPWVGEGEVNLNNLIDTAAVQSAWEGFMNDMSTDGADLVVASYLHSTAEAVDTITAESTTATQRRRNKR